eukprot:gnl/TRDRNA2_/TRDRNA2_188008_c0_seq1.p1 gnl/TRDRNA2_/TRDRNA2_188008_c0~~gnl/TRDRNA2_/TRDRNA2_188008_c0_seq1.p1  ORF type:complete len:193 (-),score=39.06 gnl/TRDRNA2_/TRDRNA2_188008_c0_seq1:47-625(-)
MGQSASPSIVVCGHRTCGSADPAVDTVKVGLSLPGAACQEPDRSAGLGSASRGVQAITNLPLAASASGEVSGHFRDAPARASKEQRPMSQKCGSSSHSELGRAVNEWLEAEKSRLRAEEERLHADHEKLRAAEAALAVERERLRLEDERLRADRERFCLDDERPCSKLEWEEAELAAGTGGTTCSAPPGETG